MHKPYFDEMRWFTSLVHANVEAKRIMLDWYARYPAGGDVEYWLKQIEEDMDERLARWEAGFEMGGFDW